MRTNKSGSARQEYARESAAHKGPILNVLGSLDDSFLPVVVSRSIPFLSPSRRTIAEIVARDPVERLFELLRPRNA